MTSLSETLDSNLFSDNSVKASTRDGFGTGVVEAGEQDERVVVLTADLSDSTRTSAFAKKFPDRFVQMGVAEQNMATVASGMASYGKIPFFTSYAAFSPGRNWEQIRTTIALNNVPAIVCGMHAGLSVGPDGATHQMLEDIALMRAMPNMIVVSPSDVHEAHKATIALAQAGKPAYMRFGREKTPVMTTPETPFEIGKAYEMYRTPHSDEAHTKPVAIIGTGPVLYNALLAGRILEDEGVATVVCNVHTIKPLDDETILALARECRAVVTVEEHQVYGGLGGAVAELLSQKYPTRMVCVGVQNTFGQTGSAVELMKYYGLSADHIRDAVRSVL